MADLVGLLEDNATEPVGVAGLDDDSAESAELVAWFDELVEELAEELAELASLFLVRRRLGGLAMQGKGLTTTEVGATRASAFLGT